MHHSETAGHHKQGVLTQKALRKKGQIPYQESRIRQLADFPRLQAPSESWGTKYNKIKQNVNLLTRRRNKTKDF